MGDRHGGALRGADTPHPGFQLLGERLHQTGAQPTGVRTVSEIRLTYTVVGDRQRPVCTIDRIGNNDLTLPLVAHLLTQEEDYAFGRPALHQAKLRQMEIKAGMPSKRGGNTPGRAKDYSIKALRDAERAFVARPKQRMAALSAPGVSGRRESAQLRSGPGARTPQPRSDCEGNAAGIASSSPLLATGSPARSNYSAADDPAPSPPNPVRKKRTCPTHPSF